MKKTVVINVVGLTPKLIQRMPRLRTWIGEAEMSTIRAVTPAVTCTAQATYLTGHYPEVHGIVGNGWYFRDECEVKFWRQSNKLVQAKKVWETARDIDSSFTCANLFWWYNMYSTADFSVTPRPMYPADGRKIPDIYTQPPDLRKKFQSILGAFPLFDFWGPRTSIKSSRWIADCARIVETDYAPTLTLIYLPHLDYCLQRWGPDDNLIDKDLQEIDEVCGDLISYYENLGSQVIVLSEYGITRVSNAVHINRVLREHGLIAIREELGLELLDPGASAAFAVADHQIAHIYINDESRRKQVRQALEQIDQVGCVLDQADKKQWRLEHPRAGDLIAIARPDAWFTYYYWLDDKSAPDFARTVDIHRKPGYDPVELFLDPSLMLPHLKVAFTLLKKRLGFRSLLNVIPLDSSLVRGSHGRVTDLPSDGPLVASRVGLDSTTVNANEIFRIILHHIFPAEAPRVDSLEGHGQSSYANTSREGLSALPD